MPALNLTKMIEISLFIEKQHIVCLIRGLFIQKDLCQIHVKTHQFENYNLVSNMIEDKSRGMNVYYTYSNKPKRIKIGNRTIKMRYNTSGYRFFKGEGANKGQVFVYNSQGQLLAKYSIGGNTLKLEFMPIYEGTKRLGMLEVSNIEWLDCPQPWLPPCYLYRTGLGIPEGRVLRANKKYELTDHLGNVRVVIADQRVPVSTNGNTVDYYKPLVKSIHDYYPFGWEKQLTTVNAYPFNYQGQLFDADLGWQYYRYRNYDPVIARFHQVEPLIDSFPMWSGYGFVNNMVTFSVEKEGDKLLLTNPLSKESFDAMMNNLAKAGGLTTRQLYKVMNIDVIEYKDDNNNPVGMWQIYSRDEFGGPKSFKQFRKSLRKLGVKDKEFAKRAYTVYMAIADKYIVEVEAYKAGSASVYPGRESAGTHIEGEAPLNPDPRIKRFQDDIKSAGEANQDIINHMFYPKSPDEDYYHPDYRGKGWVYFHVRNSMRKSYQALRTTKGTILLDVTPSVEYGATALENALKVLYSKYNDKNK